MNNINNKILCYLSIYHIQMTIFSESMGDGKEIQMSVIKECKYPILKEINNISRCISSGIM